MKYKLIPADGELRNAAIDLLSANKLPTSDLDGKELFVLVDENDTVVGTGGLELFEESALARSISVRAGMQGKGLGKVITAELEKKARAKRKSSLYLLTTTAAGFFAKEGYKEIGRDDVSEDIRSGSEFSSTCPSTAIVMKKDISPKKKILFVCIENSNRSQMSQAFATMLGENKVEAYSAGSKPSGVVNPKAIAAMKELGYSLDKHDSKSLDEVKQYAPFDVVVTMGCGDACPWMPAKKFIDWNIPDPKNMESKEFNKVRDHIRDKVQELLNELN